MGGRENGSTHIAEGKRKEDMGPLTVGHQGPEEVYGRSCEEKSMKWEQDT